VPLAADTGSDIVLPCDVTDTASLDAVFDDLRQRWGRLDFVVHAIAYSDKAELDGRYVDTSAENFNKSLLISCYSFTAIAQRAEKLMPGGGSLLTLTYYGAEKVMPHYNVMGVAKAALEASVRYLAADLGKQGIRPNQVLELMCSDLWDDGGDSIFLSLTLILVLLNLLYLDVNLSSIHPFYRDRLSKAYLVHTSRDGSLNHNDEQKLSQLNSEGSPAPYHLINTALNLQASRDPDLRGRKAGIFLFSKRFTGSERTGYCRTEEMEAGHPRLDLGTAMAISGAAAAPNMGVTTIGPLVFIMTMLNIRLGYWLPNPARFGKQGSWRAFWRPLALRGAWPRYLWREALGDVNEEKTYVNVSDGGHIENLGVYELLRRRCRLIIAIDGEADPALGFGSLIRLERFARIDMGLDLSIDLSGIRRGGDGLSKAHWALGTIRYSDDQTGHLVYIKSSVSGDEPEDVSEYRSRNPTFPHESTANQFFGEDQFEAYRALGFHIADGMLHEGWNRGDFGIPPDKFHKNI
jgi:hypothetical protein